MIEIGGSLFLRSNYFGDAQWSYPTSLFIKVTFFAHLSLYSYDCILVQIENILPQDFHLLKNLLYTIKKV
jgi:hypothetical protein